MQTIVEVERDAELCRKMISQSSGISADDGRAALSRVDEARRAAEAKAILNALQSSRWNRKQAAKLLNIDYEALLY